MVTQEEVRQKLIKRAEGEKQTYLIKQIGAPRQLIRLNVMMISYPASGFL